MTNEPQSIHEVAVIASQRNGGVGGRALERVAERKGLVLSRTSFDRMLNGTYRGRPSAATVEALAALSDVPAAHIRHLLGMPEPLRPLAEDLPPDADSLTAEQRSAVLAVVRQFASANRALARYEREQAGGSQAQGTPNTRAAGSAAQGDDDVAVPPSEADYGLAAARKPRERAHDDQSEPNE